MAAITSASLLSVQARPTRLFSLENKSRNARPRSSVVMAAGKVDILLSHSLESAHFVTRYYGRKDNEQLAARCMQACRKEQAQIMAQRAMALLAATQLLAAPIAGVQRFLLFTIFPIYFHIPLTTF